MNRAAPACKTRLHLTPKLGLLDGNIKPLKFVVNPALTHKNNMVKTARDKTVIRLPSYEKVKSDAVLYAHANRVLHLETNPGNARALVQAHGEGTTAKDVWINPPPIPLTTAEMDLVFDLRATPAARTRATPTPMAATTTAPKSPRGR